MSITKETAQRVLGRQLKKVYSTPGAFSGVSIASVQETKDSERIIVNLVALTSYGKKQAKADWDAGNHEGATNHNLTYSFPKSFLAENPSESLKQLAKMVGKSGAGITVGGNLAEFPVKDDQGVPTGEMGLGVKSIYLEIANAQDASADFFEIPVEGSQVK